MLELSARNVSHVFGTITSVTMVLVLAGADTAIFPASLSYTILSHSDVLAIAFIGSDAAIPKINFNFQECTEP